MSNELTTEDCRELVRLEEIIKTGLQTFYQVGIALATIREKRLYRDTHRTFEDYCQERWGITHQRASQLIAAKNVYENLATTVAKLPEAEWQTRPLTRFEPEQQREAWTRAVEMAPQGHVTRAHVERVVREMTKPGSATVTVPDPDSEPTSEPSRMAVHFSSETPEHYTPQVVIDATLACLGEIDLDPCSNDRDHPNVPAAQHYTQAEDGLTQEWRGRIYMNPPYGREIDLWIEKLCLEHEAGRTTEAIALVPSRTDTQWWLRLRDYPVCFVSGRLRFVGSDNSAPFPSAIFYLGENIGAFYRIFNELGDCWQRMEPGVSFGE